MAPDEKVRPGFPKLTYLFRLRAEKMPEDATILLVDGQRASHNGDSRYSAGSGVPPV